MHAPGRRAASAKKAKRRANLQMANRLGVPVLELAGLRSDLYPERLHGAERRCREHPAEIEQDGFDVLHG